MSSNRSARGNLLVRILTQISRAISVALTAVSGGDAGITSAAGDDPRTQERHRRRDDAQR